MTRLLLALALLTLPAAAIAADAGQLFARGQFAAAADQARMSRDPDSLALAARAALIVAAYDVAEKDKALMLIDEAVEDSERALALAPGHVAAMVQKAVALGYRAQLNKSPGTAKEARAVMERAARAAPSDPLVWAALGGWHGEAVAEIGRFLAGTMLGATRAESVEAYERALALDPASPVWRTLYAISLVGMGYGGETARLRGILRPAAAGEGGDAFDAMMRARAGRLLAALGDAQRLGRAAAAARPFAMIG